MSPWRNRSMSLLDAVALVVGVPILIFATCLRAIFVNRHGDHEEEQRWP